MFPLISNLIHYLSAFRNKAVADGAVSFHLDRLVSGRAARFTYGTGCNVSYNEFDSEHTSRRSMAFEGFGGLELPYGFEAILTKVCLRLLGSFKYSITYKGTEVSEQQEFRKPFILEEFDCSRCGNIQVDIVAYRGQLADLGWMDTEQGKW